MKTMHKKFHLILIGCAILLIGKLSVGTTLLALDLEALSRASDHICIGTVVDATSFLKGGRIYTLHRIAVTESIDGTAQSGEILEVVTAGGHSEWFSQKVFGAAELKTDAEYLLFLRKTHGPDTAAVVGMSQGAYPITRDPETRVRVITPPKTPPRLMKRDALSGGRLTTTTPWIAQVTPLDAVIVQIQQFIGGSR